tara:strand:- start:644 stop:952 length:309 start_codon:yes stop_codon:yes gene_type:complete
MNRHFNYIIDNIFDVYVLDNSTIESENIVDGQRESVNLTPITSESTTHEIDTDDGAYKIEFNYLEGNECNILSIQYDDKEVMMSQSNIVRLENKIFNSVNFN